MSQLSDADAPPHNEVGIWRYMDVARFLALINEKSLYFARLHELGDPWEGVWTWPASDQILSGQNGEFNGSAVYKFNSTALISCWHENERESVAMWRLYVSGREGVAVKTTVGNLLKVLKAPSVRQPTIGRVRYEDASYTPCAADYEGIPKAEWFLFRKNPGFEHEREIRAVIYDPHNSADNALHDAIFAPNGPSLSAQCSPGEALPVDLSILIERIVVSPDFPKWAVGCLQKAVDACVGVRVESSGLLDQPSEKLLGARTSSYPR